MKKKLHIPVTLFLFLTIFPYFAYSYESNQYCQKANEWIITYIIDSDHQLKISPQDIQHIANLFYLSFERSNITLQAQAFALKTIDLVWKGWQNIAQTRLDPSIKEPHLLSEEEKEKSLTTFWNLQQKHRTTGLTYAKVVEIIVNGDGLQTAIAEQSIAEVREMARHTVMQSLLDIKKQLGDFFFQAQRDLGDHTTIILDQIEQSTCATTKNNNFMDYLWAYIPQLALQSFVEANNVNNIVSEESWNALKTIQEIGNYTWRIIEKDRALFYSSYYKALYEIIEQCNLDQQYHYIIFDEDGTIPEDKRSCLLPHPKTLCICA